MVYQLKVIFKRNVGVKSLSKITVSYWKKTLEGTTKQFLRKKNFKFVKRKLNKSVMKKKEKVLFR